jgi:S1-C subfamily serine protease
VIDGATSISVTDVGNGRTYSANVVGYDRTGDVAVIKLVGASGLQTVTPATAKASVGQAVVGIGNAGGTGGTPSTAGGAVTALDQSITASDDGSGGNAENLTGLIETNAGIQPGDSGGSLVNTSGQVIGMDTAASSAETTSAAGQSAAVQAFAIPINEAVSIARQIESGQASASVHIGTTAFLGVEVSAEGPASGDGAQILGVVQGDAAANAGITGGDVITSVGGTAVTSANGLRDALTTYKPGDHVTITWENQDGGTQSASVALSSGPAA